MIINDIKLNINASHEDLYKKALSIAKINKSLVKSFQIIKRSIDARDKGNVHFVYSVAINEDYFYIEQTTYPTLKTPKKPILVVGFGPSGIFCALKLARAKFNVIVIDRGESVDDRSKTVEVFKRSAILNEDSNIQFGEGGAGTFSDGKLNTGVSSPYKKFVLNEFVKHGAPEEILYVNKPHIGSDNLPKVVKSIRQEIIALGGKVMFSTKLIDLNIEANQVVKAVIDTKGEVSEIEVSDVVLAIGHSSKDTVRWLLNKGMAMEAKDMAMGFRIEHPQSLINESQYGIKNANNHNIPTAEYKLTSHPKNIDRGVFTFCMCPGGEVVPATSNKGHVVTNGMSDFRRDKENANSAIVAQIKKSDFDNDVIKGIDFLNNYETIAFELGGGDYKAPCQLVGDFINEKDSTNFKNVRPTYAIGTKFARLDKIFDKEITMAIQESIKFMGTKIKGFDMYGAILTGVETRTSSPFRILRNDNLTSITHENVYPTGEVGYAGGIMSAALDGIKIFDKIIKKYSMLER